MKTIMAAAAVFASTFGVVPSLASPTTANSPDAGFLNNVRSIDNAGLATLVDAAPDVVINVGRSVCTMLDHGYGGEAVNGNVLDRLSCMARTAATTLDFSRSTPRRPIAASHQADSGFIANY